MRKCDCDLLAQMIMEKEFELEKNPDLNILQGLIGIYKQIIEYYEEVENPKHLDYQERLQKIFLRPSVLKLMQEDHQKQRFSKKNSGLFRRHTESFSHAHEKNTHKAHTLSAVRQRLGPDSPPNQKVVTRIMENQHKRTEQVTTKAVSDLQSQETSLRERLANRRQKGLNTSTDSSFFSSSFSLYSSRKSFTNDSFCLEFESDKSAGASALSSLHERIEKIIEDSYTEKTEKISSIKIKYQSQIAELDAEGDICREVVEALKQNMALEIEEISRRLDDKRKEMIREVKLELI